MMNMTPNRPPLANEMFHRFLVATLSASPRCDSYRSATRPWALRAEVTLHALRLSVATAPAFSYSGLAAVSWVVALTRK
jgi:hypothetical protein